MKRDVAQTKGRRRHARSATITVGVALLAGSSGCSGFSESWLGREIRDRTVGWPVEDTVPEPTMSDAAVTAAVQARLTADHGSDFSRVAVDTKQGKVVLTGTVQTWGERVRAEKLALGTKGSTGVDNRLRVEALSKP
jgi:osmotically-inducible protein OsmY